MFHGLGTGVPYSFSRRAAPGRAMCVTLNGPSHIGESLCKPSLERIILRTRSPASSVRDLMLLAW